MSETRSMKIGGILRVFWQQVRRYRFAVLGLFVSIGLATILEDVFLPLVYKNFVNGIVAVSAFQALIRILLLILGLRCLIWILYRCFGVLIQYMSSHVMADLERFSFAYLIRHSYQFFNDSFSGSLVRRVQRLSRAYDVVTDSIVLELFPLFLSITGIILVLFRIDALVGWVIFAWVVLFVSVNCKVAFWKLKYDVIRAEKDSASTGVLADAIGNSLTIKLFSGYADEEKRFFAVTEALRKMRSLTWTLSEVNAGIQWLFMIAIEFGVLYLGLRFWNQGLLTVGDFVLFQSYLIILFGKLRPFSRMLRNLYEAFADAKEMVDILETPHEIRDRRRAKPLKVTRGKIEFQNVDFNYRGTRKILDHFSLTIPSRRKIALVGSSGAGKSTIVKLLFRFYDIDAGKILIDGQLLADVTQDSLRNAIALVPQEPVLFHRTLMENIRYGRREASDEEVIDAARRAHCHEFIEALPEGYQTYVGERGVKLSGGERQRVAIARAILKNAPILVLDEATSSLDSESEALIQDALHELMKNKTVIVIAHRLSTIMQMDQIVVMEQGRVVDAGTHAELLKRMGIYQKLWNIQAGGFISS